MTVFSLVTRLQSEQRAQLTRTTPTFFDVYVVSVSAAPQCRHIRAGRMHSLMSAFAARFGPYFLVRLLVGMICPFVFPPGPRILAILAAHIEVTADFRPMAIDRAPARLPQMLTLRPDMPAQAFQVAAHCGPALLVWRHCPDVNRHVSAAGPAAIVTQAHAEPPLYGLSWPAPPESRPPLARSPRPPPNSP